MDLNQYHDIYVLRFSYNYCRKGEDYIKLDMAIFFQQDPTLVKERYFTVNFRAKYSAYMASRVEIINFNDFITIRFSDQKRRLEFRKVSEWCKTI